MMPAMEKKTGRRRAAFRFKPFSRKQKQLLFWYKAKANADKSMIIADGSIRSGKTIAMICSFLMFSMNTFENTDFIVAGKTISALKRNVVNPMLRIIARLAGAIAIIEAATTSQSERTRSTCSAQAQKRHRMCFRV